MKRNKQIARGMRNGTSPYAKYGKRPYRYPAEITQWERSVGAKVRQDAEKETQARSYGRVK